MKIIPVEKNESLEQPIPTIWRSALKKLADKVALGTDIDALTKIEIEAIDMKSEVINKENIDSYPDKLGPLHEQSWETSIYIWEPPYWAILIDLSDTNGDTTDLVFHSKICETKNGFRIEPGLIYVP